MNYNELRQIYLNDLKKGVPRNFKLKPRVRFPQMWENVQAPSNCRTLLWNDRIWIWSDPHFGHNNIIRYCSRPYEDVDQMNEHLLANYNDCVDDDDVCIWLGDVAFMADSKANEILQQCNGYKILIVGNHDFNKKKLRQLEFNEIHLLYQISLPYFDLVLTHYPIEEGLPEPHINVHGHVHNARDNDISLRHINVSCDVTDYHPVRFTDVVRKAESRVSNL